jgi:hypothetical protein
VANGTRANVNIDAGGVTQVPAITLQPLSYPSITSIANEDGIGAGQENDLVTIHGLNLGKEASLSIGINFNGTAVPANDIDRYATDSIHVHVPAGATCGPVSLTVDGVETQNPAAFWVASNMTLPATASVENTLTYQVVPSITWTTKEGETASQFGTLPKPVYSLDSNAYGSIAVTGLFTANASSVGPVNISAKLGGLNAGPLALTFLPHVTVLNLNVATADINALPATGSVDPEYASSTTFQLVANLTGDAFNNGVTWESLNPELATVNTSGLVSATNTETGGVAIIKATSVDNPALSATASITVATYGSAELEVK